MRKTMHMTQTGRVTIPTPIRQKLDIYGTEAELLMELDDRGSLVVTPVDIRPRVVGSLDPETVQLIHRLRERAASGPVTLQQIEELLTDRVAELA